MNEIERIVAEMLLAGDDPELFVLRGQLATATVLKRQFTGVGFFTYLAVDPKVVLVSRNLVIGDVYAEVSGLRWPVGFILFVQNGVLDSIECFTVDEPWPEGAQLLRIYYVHPGVPDNPQLVETEKRDMVWALRQTC